MKAGVGPKLAWLLCALALASSAGIVVLNVLNRSRHDSIADNQLIGVVLGISFSLLGAIIVSRQPENRVGWIYLLMGVLIPMQSAAALYYERSVAVGGLPGAHWAAWLDNLVTAPVWPAGLALFVFLLFPSGRLPSRRWRPVVGIAIVLTIALGAVTVLDPGRITVRDDLPKVSNPTGVGTLGKGIAGGWVGAVLFLTALALTTVTIGGPSSASARRLRRSASR